MWDIKHKSGTLLFTTCDESVADNRRTMGWVVEMKKLTVEKAQELIEQLSQGERSCREEYYLQALEAFVGCQWIACSERMPEIDVDVIVYCDDTEEQFVAYHRNDGMFTYATLDVGLEMIDVFCEPTHWRPLPGAPL